MPNITELKKLLKPRIDFMRGNFTLASGRQSDFYFNGKTTTLKPDALNYAAKIFLEMMKEDKPQRVGGLTLGADALIGGIVALSHDFNAPVEGFIVRKEPKKYGTAQWIEGPEIKANDKVIIIEDVVTTGSSAIQAIERVRETQPAVNIIGVYALVDRLEGGEESLKKLGLKIRAIFTKDELL